MAKTTRSQIDPFVAYTRSLMIVWWMCDVHLIQWSLPWRHVPNQIRTFAFLWSNVHVRPVQLLESARMMIDEWLAMEICIGTTICEAMTTWCFCLSNTQSASFPTSFRKCESSYLKRNHAPLKHLKTLFSLTTPTCDRSMLTGLGDSDQSFCWTVSLYGL